MKDEMVMENENDDREENLSVETNENLWGVYTSGRGFNPCLYADKGQTHPCGAGDIHMPRLAVHLKVLSCKARNRKLNNCVNQEMCGNI